MAAKNEIRIFNVNYVIGIRRVNGILMAQAHAGHAEH
jgi:hypothetical protein